MVVQFGSTYHLQTWKRFEYLKENVRACTSIYRSPQSNYTKYISNTKLYNSANVIRIEIYIINLIRNNILRCMQCYENNIIMAPYYTDEGYIIVSLEKGFVPPEAFVYLDRNKIIQNENGIPIFYHNFRRANVKAVNCNLECSDMRYNTSISNKDLRCLQQSNTNKFWWM